jgi:hypothetical protein
VTSLIMASPVVLSAVLAMGDSEQPNLQDAYLTWNRCLRTRFYTQHGCDIYARRHVLFLCTAHTLASVRDWAM